MIYGSLCLRCVWAVVNVERRKRIAGKDQEKQFFYYFLMLCAFCCFVFYFSLSLFEMERKILTVFLSCSWAL